MDTEKRSMEIETRQNPDWPHVYEWQLIVDGECMAGGEQETEIEATHRAIAVSCKWGNESNSTLTVNGVAI